MRATVKVMIVQTRESYVCSTAESLLAGMAKLGRRGIPAGCLNGGCGVCKIKIRTGEYRAGLMSRAHVSEVEQRAGVALACRVTPVSDIEIEVIGKMRRSVLNAASWRATGATHTKN